MPRSESPLRYFPLQRMLLVNMTTTKELDVQFNPAELDESLQVNYNHLKVLGLSHEPQQYQNTGNHSFDFELAYRVYDEGNNCRNDNLYARKFLLSLCYPMRGAQTIVGGAPPRVKFIWPNLADLACIITKVSFHHSFFGIDGTPYHFGAKVSIEEIRDMRLTSEDVIRYGTQRSAGGEE